MHLFRPLTLYNSMTHGNFWNRPYTTDHWSNVSDILHHPPILWTWQAGPLVTRYKREIITEFLTTFVSGLIQDRSLALTAVRDDLAARPASAAGRAEWNREKHWNSVFERLQAALSFLNYLEGTPRRQYRALDHAFWNRPWVAFFEEGFWWKNRPQHDWGHEIIIFLRGAFSKASSKIDHEIEWRRARSRLWWIRTSSLKSSSSWSTPPIQLCELSLCIGSNKALAC